MDSEGFIKEYHRDPYTAMIYRMMVDAWVRGYETARKDVESELSPKHLVAILLREREPEAMDRAARAMASNPHDREAILALSAIVKLAPYSIPKVS